MKTPGVTPSSCIARPVRPQHPHLISVGLGVGDACSAVVIG
jgi:hypothetical protein